MKTRLGNLIPLLIVATTIVPIAPAQAQQRPNTQSAPSSRSTTPPDPNCPIKGNISQTTDGQSTGRRLYHLPGMRDYERTVIDLSRGERWFCSEAEAIAAGWAKAPR
ncbi:MAG: hypothetical protein ACAF42_14300 [Limnothrix sp. BL-A-16]|jgi:hypothetical protein